MPTKVRRYVSLFVLGSFLVLITLFVLARLVITPERIKTVFVPVVERYFHCNINLESVDVSLFSGVSLSNLELLNNVDGAMILAADKVVLRYQILPLFVQRIVIDEIRLEHPRVNVERYPGGSINLYDFFTQKRTATQQGSFADDLPSDMNILISHLYIQRGELLFKDYSFGSAPHRYKLTDFDLHVTNFSLQNDFSFELWGKVNDAPIDAEGTVNLNEQRYDLDLVIDHLEMVQFQPYYRGELNGRIDDLILSIDARLNIEQESLDSTGGLQLQHLDYSSATYSDLSIQAEKVDLQFDVSFSQQQKMTIKKLHLDYDGMQADIDGDFAIDEATPDINLHVSVPQWSLRKSHALLPGDLATSFSGYDIAGDVNLDLMLRGHSFDFKKIIKQSTITLDSVQASIDNLRPSISGTIKTTGDTCVADDLSLVLGDNTLHLNVLSKNIWARRPIIETEIKAESFNFNTIATRLRSDFGGAGSGIGDAPLTSRELTEPSGVNLPFDVIGTLSIDDVTVNEIDCSTLKSQFSLRNNLFQYDSLTCAVADGTLDSSGHVDLTQQGFAYSGHITGRGLQLTELLQAYDPSMMSSASGVLAVTVDYSGAGTQKLRVQQNLSGSGTFGIENGDMSGTAFMDELSSFFGLTELQVFHFSEGRGTFKLNTGGQLNYDAQFLGNQLRIYPIGTGQYSGALAAQVAVYLSPELAAKLDSNSRLIPYLQQRDGWSFMPLSVTGNLDAPHVTINFEKAGRSALQHVGDVVIDELKERVEGQSDPTTGKAQIELIESVIEGLLDK